MTRKKVRKWKEDYTEYGFTKTIVDGKDKPQCMFCYAVFFISNLKPLIIFFSIFFNSLKAKRARYGIKGTAPKLGFGPEDKILLFALYKVVYQVTKVKKPHIIAETRIIIKPCGLEMVKAVHGSRTQKTATDSSLRQYHQE